ncbi:MAG: TlpA family protein disulfide reductase [Arcobacter sp.]|uniref:Protein disulfide reductase, TlpA family n=1 Tax=Arcobacter defluvii TaxID=873191 RepID=A0AAE7BCX3_9BACT|nr:MULTISPECIES: TlpA disulfide reductase family protein [Arcobacter]MDY3201041.1 TlpA disulfide reductase family protein [Arcobacter sp.]QKF77100.1 protein disulfide reductase, TlpA family [Arcobacter defluvii]RXI33607.1 TlpA family protein disulfide reductase [Arcobacter defluvii]BAK73002.1 putative lipoprotein thiredoxin [Arcobacter sp. L]
MQFKSLAFLSILFILFFTGCDSKDKNENNNETKIEKVDRKTDFQLKTTDNTIIDLKLENDKIILKDYPNKIVLLNFFATWCPPCKAEIPNLVKLQENYKNDFVVISVLLEEMKTNEEILDFIKSFDINYTVVNTPDSFDLAKSLGGIKSIPTMFLVDKNSKIFQKYVGLVPAEMMEIDIKKVLEK